MSRFRKPLKAWQAPDSAGSMMDQAARSPADPL
jgi:hypothetical protein